MFRPKFVNRKTKSACMQVFYTFTSDEAPEMHSSSPHFVSECLVSFLSINKIILLFVNDKRVDMKNANPNACNEIYYSNIIKSTTILDTV